MRRGKKWLVFSGILLIVVIGTFFIVFEFVLKQKPFATAEDYWAQKEKGRLTTDALGHWTYAVNTADVLSYSQDPFFDMPRPYDMEMYRKWVEENRYNEIAIRRVYEGFSQDGDYGWPAELRGTGWLYAAEPFILAAPSVAIIEPGRTAEAVFVLNEFIKLFRSPAVWLDYAITWGYDDPMRDNMMWKGPLLIGESLYALMTGDKDKYGPEAKAIAQNLYELQKKHLRMPLGKGFSGGVECEPNHWYPQCNSIGIIALAIYDRVYGKDEKYGIEIGKAYRENYLKFLKDYMMEPGTYLIYRRWHPYGPQMADKNISASTNIFVSMNLHAFYPDFGKKLYEHVRFNYVRRYPLGIGYAILEVPQKNLRGRIINPASNTPGMLGLSYLNIFAAWVAAKEMGDKETFDGINRFLTNLTHPYFIQGEIRFDETNPEPAGLGKATVGQILNMHSGWWLLAKVHVGWKTILEHDWSKHRDKEGHLLNNP